MNGKVDTRKIFLNNIFVFEVCTFTKVQNLVPFNKLYLTKNG